MVSRALVFCALTISALAAGDFSTPGRVEASQQAVFAAASTKAVDVHALDTAPGASKIGNTASSITKTTSGNPENTQPIQYIGEITKWFSITISAILAIYAFLITTVQIGVGIHLSRNEEKAKQRLKEDMANKIEALRIRQKQLVKLGVEEYAREFDKTILNEIQRMARKHVEVHNIIERAKIELTNARLSEGSAEGSGLKRIFMQSMQDTIHLMELVSGKDKDIFNGLGYIKDQVSGIRQGRRPGAIPDLLKALNSRNELQERNNYMIAAQICKELYATSLD